MKLSVFSRPQIEHLTIGTNLSKAIVAEYDATKRTIHDMMDVLSSKFFGLERHVHFSFYFVMNCNDLMEVLCHSQMTVTKDEYDENQDEGILSGSLEQICQTIFIFCQKNVSIELRMFFNRMNTLLEGEGVRLPFKKVDNGDSTFTVRSNV